MNNRRSFFKSLALLGAAAASCPGIFIPKFEPVKWKVKPAVLNPRDYFGGWYFAEFSYIAKPIAGGGMELLQVRDSDNPDWRTPTVDQTIDFHMSRIASRMRDPGPSGTWKFKT